MASPLPISRDQGLQGLGRGTLGPPGQGQAGGAHTPGSCIGNVLQGSQVCVCCLLQQESPLCLLLLQGGQLGDLEQLEKHEADEKLFHF